MGNGGGAGEIAGAGGTGLALVVAIEGVGGVSLDGVGEETEAVGLNGKAIGSRTACIVQRSLKGLAASVASGHAPTPSSSSYYSNLGLGRHRECGGY